MMRLWPKLNGIWATPLHEAKQVLPYVGHRHAIEKTCYRLNLYRWDELKHQVTFCGVSTPVAIDALRMQIYKFVKPNEKARVKR